jgi:para-nitrobenzyl esterase
MAYAEAAPLFDRAIVESGSALVSSERVKLLKDAEATGQKLAAALGVKEDAGTLAAMRALPWEKVIEAGAKKEVGFSASVVVDGHVIPEPISTIFETGKQAKVPLIVGANAGEAMLQTSVPLMANLHSKAGNPTWVYNFTQLPKGWRDEPGCVAFHGLELTYVFGAVPLGLSSPTTLYLAGGGGCSNKTPVTDESDTKVADDAATVWAQFAKTGNPSVAGLIDWPAYTEQNNNYLDIGAPLTAKTNVQASFKAPPKNAARAAP